jgi:hypothetical protein
LDNGLSVITFIQNISDDPVTVDVTFVPDPDCPFAACSNPGTVVRSNIVIQPNERAFINPRNDNSLPAPWSGSAIIETDDGSDSIIAFGNQVNTVNPNAGGYGGRNVNNTSNSLFCPYLISGLPNYGSSGQASTLLIQNVGDSSTDVTVEFVAGVGSPTNYNNTFSPVSLDSGERLAFNFRTSDTDFNKGVPNNWYGSAKITASGGGNITAVANLFNKLQKGSDTLGAYNCVSESTP